MGTLIGWLIVAFTYFLVSRSSVARVNPSVRKALYVVLTVHHLISFVNAHIMFIPGGEADADSFHNRAYRGQLNFYHGGAARYVEWLHWVYGFTGASKFLGQELSVLAFTLTCLLLLDLIHLCRLEDKARLVIMGYGLLPSVAVYTSLTLRESYESLFVVAAVTSAVRIAYRRTAWSYALLPFSCYLLAYIHKGLSIFAVFLLAISVLLMVVVSGTWKLHPALLVMQILVGGLLFFFGVLEGGVADESSDVVSKAGAGLSDYASSFRDVASKGARADYGAELDMESLEGLLVTAPVVFILYMVCPLPWQVETGLDLYAAFESILRVFLVFASMATVSRSRGPTRVIGLFLLVTFFALEGLWSAGTVNWGTALRHHTSAYFIIALLGYPALAAGTPGGEGRTAPVDVSATARRRGRGNRPGARVRVTKA